MLQETNCKEVKGQRSSHKLFQAWTPSIATGDFTEGRSGLSWFINSETSGKEMEPFSRLDTCDVSFTDTGHLFLLSLLFLVRLEEKNSCMLCVFQVSPSGDWGNLSSNN